MTNNRRNTFPKWWNYQFRRKKNLKLWLERILAGPSYNQIIVAIVLFLIVFFFVGSIHYQWDFSKAFADMSSPVTLRNTAYENEASHIINIPQGTGSVTLQNTAQDTGRKSTSTLIWVYILGSIVFSGLLIATITNVLRTWADRFKQGTVRYYSFRDHTVILGYNDMVPGMIERMCGDHLYPNGIRIVIGVNSAVHEVATQLSNHLSIRQRRCVVVLQADSCNSRDLKRLRTSAAQEVYILSKYDDAYSLNSFNKIQKLCQKKQHYPECYIQIQYQSTFALFQTYTEGLSHFHAFNFHDIWARQIVMHPIIDTRDGGLCMGPQSDKQVHIVIIGMTEMGEAIAREAAYICHFPNYITKGIRTRITFIDPQAKEQMTYFKGRYHHLFNLCRYSLHISGLYPEYYIPQKDFLDIEFEFIEANIADTTIQQELSDWAKDEHQLLTIAVCADLPHRSMAAGLYLPNAVFEHNIPIWIYQPAKGDIKDYLSHSRFDNTVTFGTSGSDLDIKNDEIIQQAKRLNHFYRHCSDKNIEYEKKTIDAEWDETKIYDKWSNIYNVTTIPTKLRSINGIENLNENNDIIAHVEHNRWNIEKLLMGFRPTTDDEHQQIIADGKMMKLFKKRLIHDDIRPYGELKQGTADIDRKLTQEIPQILLVK